MGTRQARRAPSQEPPLNSRTICPQRIVEKVWYENHIPKVVKRFNGSGHASGSLVTRMDIGRVQIPVYLYLFRD